MKKMKILLCGSKMMRMTAERDSHSWIPMKLQPLFAWTTVDGGECIRLDKSVVLGREPWTWTRMNR